MVTKPWRELLE